MFRGKPYWALFVYVCVFSICLFFFSFFFVVVCVVVVVVVVVLLFSCIFCICS